MEECKNCGGSGVIERIGVWARCCGNLDQYGGCCDNPEPEPCPYPEQCDVCQGTGKTKTEP